MIESRGKGRLTLANEIASHPMILGTAAIIRDCKFKFIFFQKKSSLTEHIMQSKKHLSKKMNQF